VSLDDLETGGVLKRWGSEFRRGDETFCRRDHVALPLKQLAEVDHQSNRNHCDCI